MISVLKSCNHQIKKKAVLAYKKNVFKFLYNGFCTTKYLKLIYLIPYKLLINLSVKNEFFE